MKQVIDKSEFEAIAFHILCSAPRTTKRYKTEIDWEYFGINDCIEKYEELSVDESWATPDWFYKLYQTLCQKNSDYSPVNDAYANFRMCESMWVSVEDGIKVRLCDKVSRVRNLQKKEPDVVWESLADTYLDIAGYLLLLYIWVYWDSFCAETVCLNDLKK